MDLHILTHAPEQRKLEALVLFVFDKDGFAGTPEFARYDAYTAGELSAMFASGEFTGKKDDLVVFHRPAGLQAARLILAGCGKRDAFTAAHLRQLAGAALRTLKQKSAHNVAYLVEPHLADPAHIQALMEGAVAADYETDNRKTDPKRADKFITSVAIIAPGADADMVAKAADTGRIVGQAQNLARELGNEPPNILNPATLAARAEAMAKTYGLESELLDAAKMRALGMGALLGVAQGSVNEPYFIVLKYRPQATTSTNHLAIVGKAVTFDTGGISIKPSDGMEQMKFDMCGGAAAIGAMQAIAQLKPPIPVTAYVPAVENMPGGRAQRPGDIVTSLSGKTIEVLNTDAEGRLILVDAITYAKRDGVTHMVDLATLTGAIVMALGRVNTGLFTNNEAFQKLLLEAASQEGEKMWPMPMDDDYKEQLKNPYADMPNIGTKGAGATTAALFLKEWVEDTPWCHLDIAGTAWTDSAKPHLAQGPTGVGVRTLVRLASRLAG